MTASNNTNSNLNSNKSPSCVSVAPLRCGLFFFRIMSQISCSDPRCRRWWTRAFVNPKSCDEHNPPKLHIYQAPKKRQKTSKTSNRPDTNTNNTNTNNDNDNNDSKMTTRSSQETTNEANSPVRSANDMVRVSGSIYFWLRFVLHQFEFTLFFSHSSPFFHSFRYDLHGILLQTR